MTDRYMTAGGVTTKVEPDLPHLSILSPNSVGQFKIAEGKECLIEFWLSDNSYQLWATVHMVNDFGMNFTVNPPEEFPGDYHIPWENIRMVEV